MKNSKKSTIAKNVSNVEIINSNLPAIIAKDIEHTEILNNNVLDALNALSITDKAQKTLSGKKSIFKLEYNNKNSRSKIRTKLYGTNNAFGLLELYLKNLKENKLEEAEKCFSTISEICNDAYISGTSFESYNQYATDNLDADKLGILKTFILVRKELILV